MKTAIIGVSFLLAMSNSAPCTLRMPLLTEQGALGATLTVRQGEASLNYADSHAAIFLPGHGDPYRRSFAAALSGVTVAYNAESCDQHAHWDVNLEPEASVRFFCRPAESAGPNETLRRLIEHFDRPLDLVLPYTDQVNDAPFVLVFDRNERFLAIWQSERLAQLSDAPRILIVGNDGISAAVLSSVLEGDCDRAEGCSHQDGQTLPHRVG